MMVLFFKVDFASLPNVNGICVPGKKMQSFLWCRAKQKQYGQQQATGSI